MMCLENMKKKKRKRGWGRKLQEKRHVLWFWHTAFHIPTPCPCVIPEHLMDEKDNC